MIKYIQERLWGSFRFSHAAVMTDPRFVKNGNSAIDNLLTYYLEAEAKFEHGRGAGANAMATDQATYGLVAYDRLVRGLDYYTKTVFEIIAETSLGYTFSEPLTSFIRPAYTIVSEEPEILESLGQKMLSSHTSGQIIVSSNVRYLSEFPDEILS